MMTDVQEYDYDLPHELIAQQPLAQRTDARLLVVDRAQASISHHYVRDLPDLLNPSDCLVFNDTRVVPARLVGHRQLTGGRWEGLFLASDQSGVWKLLGKTRGKLAPGERVVLYDQEGRDSLNLELIRKETGGVWWAKPQSNEPAEIVLQRIGRIPLPCYIRSGMASSQDSSRYQTVFAQHSGSAAAPTAGLHFSADLIERLRARCVSTAMVTLHIGLDTFRPIKTNTVEQHAMHAEWGRIEPQAVAEITRSQSAGGRVVAVGTTAVRILETASQSGELQPWQGETRLFIHRGYKFRTVDVLLTNFHLPRSTLLVLVHTFGGGDLVRRAYQAAIDESYRFYSYGDAMLIV